jgi:DNA (cytosine-5)-methyltransferase 1
MSEFTFGSLFAGIGGIDLGFERCGMRCKWQVEINDYATKVLEKHWPEVHRERDIRQCGASNLERVDVIAGGFPCQDISYAGLGAGLDGERSGLFFEAIRLVRELQPRAVVLENVSALLTRGLDRVLGTLAEIGYDAQWHCIPAAYVGAPHIRDRVFVLAYSKHNGLIASERQYSGDQQQQGRSKKPSGVKQSQGSCRGQSVFADVADTRRELRKPRAGKRPESNTQAERGSEANDDQRRGEDVAYTAGGRWKRSSKSVSCGESENANRKLQPAGNSCGGGGWWAIEPAVGRVANGVPRRVDRLRGLGNAVVPQVAELVGRMVTDILAKQSLAYRLTTGRH